MIRYGITLLIMAAVASPMYAQRFGGTVSIGDSGLFVAETRNRGLPGEVYVFDREAPWQTQARLTASNEGAAPDGFGRHVSANGDQVLVGMVGSEKVKGAAYLFRKGSDGSWNGISTLAGPDDSAGAAFGASVLLAGHLALVAAPQADLSAGHVYVYEPGAGGVFQEAGRLQGSDTGEGDMFGIALAVNEHSIFVGAPAHADGRGAVYVFFRDAAGSWAQSEKIEAGDLPASSGFGTSLVVDKEQLYVGAPGYERRAGAVFQFSFDTESRQWRQHEVLTAFEDGRNVQFGTALAMDGSDLWVGAPGGGAVYRYRRGPAGWSGVTKLLARDADARGAFGSAIAVREEIAVIGAESEDAGEGAAHVFEREGNEWKHRARVVNELRGYQAIRGEEVRCEDGAARAWSCEQVDLISFVPLGEMGGVRGTRANDLWGWTDSQTGREYALVGRSDGTAFVDITDPHHPVFVGDLPMTAGSRANVWRDIKVYRDHAYVVADGAGEHGVQVFDLAGLRTVESPPETFSETALYDKIHSAHNIVINEETGHAFVVGASGGGETCGGGLHMMDIRDPKSPEFAGCFADPTTGRRKTGYSHDAQCVTYAGPDTAYRGREICIGSNETAISISDVSDKDNPVPVAAAAYPNVAYTHQGWLTEDHRYFYMNDEGDEPRGLVEGTRTLVWDLADLDDPVLVKEYVAETTTTDHNLYIKGNLMYQSNYGSGLRILDITDPEDPVEIGFFDTAPYDAGGGSWSNYPYFESGIIIVTSTGEGLFVLRQRQVDT